MKAFRWSIVAAMATLSGCAVGPNFTAPVVATPAAFVAETEAVAGRNTAVDEVDIRQWWRSLHDKELDSLVDRALTSNLDLQIALTRVQEARERVFGTGATLLPAAEIVGGGGGGSGSDETNGRVPSAYRAAENAKGLNVTDETAGLFAAWDLDLFGRVKREIEAERAEAEAAKYARDYVFVTVAADVARAYLDMRAQERQLAVLGENIKAAQGARGLAQSSLDRGLGDALDVKLAERELATLEANRGPLVGQIENSRHAIATLLGTFPENVSKELARGGAMPGLPARIPVGLPAQLLRRRPDIAEIEQQLVAANARVGEAIAQLFPDVTVTGTFGQQAGAFEVGAHPAQMIWSLGPSVSTPFLDFGALDAAIAGADLKTHEILVSYREAILKAVRQVDDAGATLQAQRRRLSDLDRALTAAREATQIATERYDRGLTDFLNVLDAERQQYALEELAVQAKQVEAEALVALFEALGGGWAPSDIPPPRRPQMAIVAAFKYATQQAQGQ